MRKAGIGGTGLLDGKPKHPGSSLGLLYRVEEGGRLLQLNKGVGLLHADKETQFMVHSWTKETG